MPQYTILILSWLAARSQASAPCKGESNNAYSYACPGDAVSIVKGNEGLVFNYDAAQLDNAANPTELIDLSGYGYAASFKDGKGPAVNSEAAKGIDAQLTRYMKFDGVSNYLPIKSKFYKTKSLKSMTAGVWFRTSFGNYGCGKCAKVGTFDNWAFLDFDRSEYFNCWIDDVGMLRFSTSHEDGQFQDTQEHTKYGGLNKQENPDWHYAVWTFGEGTKNIYRDGLNSGTETGFADIGVGSTRYGFIGDGSEASGYNKNRNNIYYDGHIGMIHYFETEWSQQDVRDMYDATKKFFQTCEAGFYCEYGYTTLTCPVGNYCPDRVNVFPNASWHYYPCAFDFNTGTHRANQYYCTGGNSLPVLVPEGSYSTGGADNGYNRSSIANCGAGYFCTGGVQAECGGVGHYCPGGGGADASSPSPVSAGWYSIGGGADGRTRTGQLKCQAGTYCLGGQEFPCPESRYGSATGESNSLCAGACAAGYHCPQRSTSPQQEPCGCPGGDCGADPQRYYCPPGQPRMVVPADYFSGPEDADAKHRSTIAPCPEAHVCVNGSKVPELVWDACDPDVGLELSVDENAPSAAIGTYTATSSHKAAHTVSYSLRDTAGAELFAVDSSSGALAVGSTALNYDPLAQAPVKNTEYALTLVATATPADAGPSAAGDQVYCPVTVAVVDTNDQPEVSVPEPVMQVAEKSDVNTAVGMALGWIDEDGENQDHFFSIIGGNEDGFFKISTCGGQVSVAKKGLDFGVRNKYTLSVRVEDDTGPTADWPVLRSEGTVQIELLDVNDAPMFARESEALWLYENTEAGTMAVNASGSPYMPWSDPDTGDSVTWAITRNDDDAFAIDEATGEVTNTRVLDKELKVNYNIEVTITDEGTPGVKNSGLSASMDVTLEVKDANDPPSVEYSALSVREDGEDAPFPCSGCVSVSDQDGTTDAEGGRMFTFALSTSPGANAGDIPSIFDLNDAGQFVVRAGGAAYLDYETRRNYSVTVNVSDTGLRRDGASCPGDAGGGVDYCKPRWSDVTVLVHVSDVNEAPVLLEQAFEVPENATVGSKLGKVQFTDPEEGQVHTFATSCAGAPCLQVGIRDSLSDAFEVLRSLDYETSRESFLVSVTVTDSGSLSDVHAVPVQVVNTNDAPVIASELKIYVNESNNALEGTAVFLGSLDNGADCGISGTDCNGNKVYASDQDALNTDAQNFGLSWGACSFILTDADGSPSEIFELVPDVDGDPNHRNLALRAGRVLDYEAMGGEAHAHELVVTAVDGGNQQARSMVTVHVRDVNDAPMMDDAVVLFSVTKVASAYTTIRAVPVHDADTDDTPNGQHTCSITAGNDLGCFSISAGNQIQVMPAYVSKVQAFELTEGDQFVLTIRCADHGIPSLSASQTYTVQITEGNLVPRLPPVSYTVDENHADGPVACVEDGDGCSAGKMVVSDDDASLKWEVVGCAIPRKGTDEVFSCGSHVNKFSVMPEGVKAQLVIKTLDGGATALDFEDSIFAGDMQQYVLTLQFTDDGAPVNATSSSQVTVTVKNLNEAPVFAPLSITIKESCDHGGAACSKPGDVLSPRLVDVVSDPDAANTLAENYGENMGAISFAKLSGSDLFSVDSATGAIALLQNISYESGESYVLSIEASDGATVPKIAVADVTILVQDVNEPPVCTPSYTFSVPENSAVETLVDEVGGTDPDGRPLAYSIASGNTGDAFRIDAISGEIRVKGAIDFEATSRYNLSVQVEDKGELSCFSAVTVDVIDGNDMLISSLSTRTGDVDAMNCTVHGDPTDSLCFSTDGGATVLINGSDFGAVGTAVTATYGRFNGAFHGVVMAAVGCKVAVHNTLIECESAAGVGSNHRWNVSAGKWWVLSPASVTSGYHMPRITSVEGAEDMATKGGQQLRFTGTSFGLAGTVPEVSYSFGSTVKNLESCVVKSHALITCTSVSGVGHGLVFRVHLGGQTGPWSTSASGNFMVPAITSVTLPTLLQTAGGEAITLSGTNFGPSDTVVSVQYASYVASGCSVQKAHTEVVCLSASGIGKGFPLNLTVGAQTSAASETVVAYQPPAIGKLSGQGSNEASTKGGQQILLSGSNFGAEVDKLHVSYGGAGAGRFTARQCAILVAHTQLECMTAEGTGAGHNWRVTVNGQVSEIYDADTAYAQPVIYQITKADGVTTFLDVQTAGNETVIITGRNFGTIASGALERVMYGDCVNYEKDAVTGADTEVCLEAEYIARDCAVTRDHETVVCTTAPGGGKSHKWLLFVDGQRSTAPTTAYAPPHIETIATKFVASKDLLSTHGGDVVVLQGSNFGNQICDAPRDNVTGLRNYADCMFACDIDGTPDPAGAHRCDKMTWDITYGPSGTEFPAVNCRFEVPDSTLECQTVPGMGGKLVWMLNVKGQTFLDTTITAAYAPPAIAYVEPASGTVSTRGSTFITLTGANFGRPGDANVYFGTNDDGSARKIAPFDCVIGAGDEEDKLVFMLPEGHGKNRLFVEVGGQTSADYGDAFDGERFYEYGTPAFEEGGKGVVLQENELYEEGALDMLLYGANFGAASYCVRVNGTDKDPVCAPEYQLAKSIGRVYIGASIDSSGNIKDPVQLDLNAIRLYDHEKIHVYYTPTDISRPEGVVQVWVGDPDTEEPQLQQVDSRSGSYKILTFPERSWARSKAVEFKNFNPVIIDHEFRSEATCSYRCDADGIADPAGDRRCDSGVCSYYQYTDNEGVGNGPVKRARTQGGEALCPPQPGSNVSLPCTGVFVVRGRYFGDKPSVWFTYKTPQIGNFTSEAYERECVATSITPVKAGGDALEDYTEVKCTLPEGQGAGVEFVVKQFADSSAALASAPRAFSYHAPSISSWGGEPVPVMSDGTSAADGVVVRSPTAGRLMSVGGRDFGTRFAKVRIDGAYCAVANTTHSLSFFDVPEGEGTGLQISVWAANQVSPSFRFDYDPPSIDGIDASADPAKTPHQFTLRGSNFGGYSLCKPRGYCSHETLCPGKVGQRSGPASLYTRCHFVYMRTAEGGEEVECAIQNRATAPHTHTHMDIDCGVWPLPGSASFHLTVSNQAAVLRTPIVTQAVVVVGDDEEVSLNRPRTGGGATLRVRGAHFRSSPVTAHPPTIEVGGKTCALLAGENRSVAEAKADALGYSAATDPAGSDVLYCRVPKGSGRLLDVRVRRGEVSNDVERAKACEVSLGKCPLRAVTSAALELQGKAYASKMSYMPPTVYWDQVVHSDAYYAYYGKHYAGYRRRQLAGTSTGNDSVPWNWPPVRGEKSIKFVGTNFGAGMQLVWNKGTVNEAVIPVTDLTETSFTADIPAGEGAGHSLIVTIGGGSGGGDDDVSREESEPHFFSYHPPVVEAVETRTGDVSGSCRHDDAACPESGARAQTRGGTMVTLTGLNFGDNRTIGYWRYDAALPSGRAWQQCNETAITATGEECVDQEGQQAHWVSLGNRSCAVSEWSNTRIVCEAPEGQGKGINLVVHASRVPGGGCCDTAADAPAFKTGGDGAGASSSSAAVASGVCAGFAFSYFQPVITAMRPLEGPTSGGTAVTLIGSNFGMHGAVRMGDPNLSPGLSATMPSMALAGGGRNHSHDSIVFITAPDFGLGGARPVTVSISGHEHTFPTPFKYSAPEITGPLPAPIPTHGKDLSALAVSYGGVANIPIYEKYAAPEQVITITGSSFGAPMAISVDAARREQEDAATASAGNATGTGTGTDTATDTGTAAAASAADSSDTLTAPRREEFTAEVWIWEARPDKRRVKQTPGRNPDGRWYDCSAETECRKCKVHTQNHSHIVCAPGANIGAGLRLQVAMVGFSNPKFGVMGQASKFDTHQLSSGDASSSSGAQVVALCGDSSSGALCQTSPTSSGAFSYAAPRIEAVIPTGLQVDAAGGQRITVVGENFGNSASINYGTRVWVGGQNCTSAEWVDPWIAGTPETSLARGTAKAYEYMRDKKMQRPYVTCTSPLGMTVGCKNITIDVAGQMTTFVPNFELGKEIMCAQCKGGIPGFFGGPGEFCVSCSNNGQRSGLEGAECLADGLLTPTAKLGFWQFNVSSDDPRCPAQLQQTRTQENCPIFAACEPKDACIGENLCREEYSGERCSLCAESFYRLAGECVPCPKCPICIVLLFLGFGSCACICSYVLTRKHINLGILSIGVDYFQVISILASSNQIQWPQQMKDILANLAIFNFNLDLMAPECSFKSFKYEYKWISIEFLPLIAIFFFSCSHVAKWAHKKHVLGRTKKLHNHGHLVIGTSIITFYYLYLYISKTSLDMFNCSPVDPDDGSLYLEVIFEKCYEAGSMHMQLLPWAVIFLIIYTLGFPLLCCYIIMGNRERIKEDQLLRARDLGNTRATNPNCYDFRKRYHRLYYQFKPSHYYWILTILARKFGIAMASLLFRRYPVFLLSFCLMILFTSYALQVRHMPYMSMSERAAVVAKHEAEKLQTDKHKYRNNNKCSRKSLQKKIKFGERMEAKRLDRSAEYFWNYNAVEAVLLACAVLLILCGLMFQSEQIRDGTSQQIALLTIALLIIFCSIVYFVLVLASEIIIGLGCGAWLVERFGSKGVKAIGGSPVGRTAAKSDGGDLIMMDTTMHQVNPLVAKQRRASREGGSSRGKDEKLVKDLNMAHETIQQLQGELLELKKKVQTQSLRAYQRSSGRKMVNKNPASERGRKKFGSDAGNKKQGSSNSGSSSSSTAASAPKGENAIVTVDDSFKVASQGRKADANVDLL